MPDTKWIKIVTDLFDDEKIMLIETMPEADTIIVIWFKLLCLAGKQNNRGVFVLNDAIPYNVQMFAAIFRRKETVVQLALSVFEKYGMIEIVDDVVTIPNWGKHQNIAAQEKRKSYMKGYMQDYRNKQKQIAENKAPVNSLHKPNINNAVNNVNSLRKPNVSRTDKEDNKDNKYKQEKYINKSLSSEPPPAATDGESPLTASENAIESGTTSEELGSGVDEQHLLGRRIDHEQNLDVPGTTPNEIGSSHDCGEVLSGQIGTEQDSGKQKKTRKKPCHGHDSVYYKSAKWLAKRIEARVEGYKEHTESQLQEWADSARLMFEVDKRDKDLANRLLKFSQEDEFWRKNILSMPKFRKQFDALLARYHEDRGKKDAQDQKSPLDTGYVNLTGRKE